MIQINEEFFTALDESSSYILGFIAADGTVSILPRNGGVVEICLKDSDRSVLEYVSRQISNGRLKIRHKIIKEKKYARISICRRKIVNDLISLGVTPRKSLTLKFPVLQKKLIRHFIRGYFDGDGYIRTRIAKRFGHKYITLECSMLGTFDFLKMIQKYFIELCYKKSVGSLRSQKKWYNAWRLTFCTASAQKFAGWIYDNCNFALVRKRKIYTDFLSLENKKII